MIRGQQIGLRARHEEDVAVLHSELYDDVRTQAVADSAPWRPIPVGSKNSPYATQDDSSDIAYFSVELLATAELAGEALLWGIDTYNRRAHLGISLRPGFRGRGLGLDVVRVLCEYGFAVRGLHRLQIETAGDNQSMIKAALRAGFTHEGTLRRSAWGYGTHTDEAVLGLLHEEWAGRG
ncbi:GNAT family N-acetyltransferase [Streptomyces montanisoli]|uniref:GNAT family N-acetyltransferase n=1 Tax=Streptomyces montanisoli TaxID=2798581 RepID=A0A940MAF7_9ACTN|nr:GNAT family protein [Streptomyces montanisoli]MBP0456866.1 GNAT family N-acetyltransferase [Streptomyces montanisoli]